MRFCLAYSLLAHAELGRTSGVPPKGCGILISACSYNPLAHAELGRPTGVPPKGGLIHQII